MLKMGKQKIIIKIKSSIDRREGLPKSQVFNWLLKTSSEGGRRITDGRLFQSRGATAEKARFLVLSFQASLGIRPLNHPSWLWRVIQVKVSDESENYFQLMCLLLSPLNVAEFHGWGLHIYLKRHIANAVYQFCRLKDLAFSNAQASDSLASVLSCLWPSLPFNFASPPMKYLGWNRIKL